MERTYRRSLARFPKTWREEHSDIVLGMLLDDAEAKGLDKVPVAQRASLRFQAMAEHYTFKRVRILALAATGFWLAGLVLGAFPGLIQGSILESANFSGLALASLDTARSFVSFAVPYFLTILALTGFLYRSGWLGVWLRPAVNILCGLGLGAGTIGSWLFMVDYVENFSTPLNSETALADSLNAWGYIFTRAVPALLLLGLAWHALSIKAGRTAVVVVVALLAVIFADMVFAGGGLIRVIAPALILAAWRQERTPLPWLGENAAPRDASRPHFIEWTHG